MLHFHFGLFQINLPPISNVQQQDTRMYAAIHFSFLPLIKLLQNLYYDLDTVLGIKSTSFTPGKKANLSMMTKLCTDYEY